MGLMRGGLGTRGAQFALMEASRRDCAPAGPRTRALHGALPARRGLLRALGAAALWLLAGAGLLRAAPAVSNVTFSQRAGTRLVDVFYDLGGTGTPPAVGLAVSSDGGATFAVPVNTVSGDVGAGVPFGTGKHMVWDAGADWAGQLSTQVQVEVRAWDLDMAGVASVPVPGGAFQRGDSLDGLADAPLQTITLSTFYLQSLPVSKTQWDSVRTWGSTHGYTDLSTGAAKAAAHPVHSVTWHDMVKWCNAASEMEGLAAVYKVGGSVLRTGSSTGVTADWGANGYRLPTEAEWEKGARGGLVGKRFPWGDTITHTNASYYSSASYAYDVSATRGYHPTYGTGATPYTSPVGGFAANGYGLYDMAGNVFERCWDVYGTYQAVTDPRGPGSGSNRVLRGGFWGISADYLRCAQRYYDLPGTADATIGFRPARSRP